MKIIRAQTPTQIEEVRRLFREYEDFLGVDLCFQGFEEELAGLPGKYAPPDGAILIATDGHEVAGCVALRKLEAKVCEMKRLFVRSQYKGQGLGRILAERIIDEASQLGYSFMWLDTFARLKEAMRLYESLGFKRRKAYYQNPLPGVVYLELELNAPKNT
ncbi:MAG: GNAT family N-acetyltransferase [Proteobacteria bacterium]|nr:GNAT family N-acetyltransferase [Pseudomonadota bacterium]NIS68583.1 GNAT family N-acetyltransferase [Pseudomonadota bacterium]